MPDIDISASQVGLALATLTGIGAVGVIVLILTGRIGDRTTSTASTLLLVLVTLTYAILTYALVSETRRSRQQSVQPVIEVVTDSDAVTTAITNIGNGPARVARLTLRLRDEAGSNGANETHTRIDNLGVGQRHYVKESPFSKLADQSEGVFDRYTHLDVEGTVTDAFDNDHSVSVSYELEEIGTPPGADNDPLVQELRNLREDLGST